MIFLQSFLLSYSNPLPSVPDLKNILIPHSVCRRLWQAILEVVLEVEVLSISSELKKVWIYLMT
jgi:hypothetical protein